MEDDIQYHLLRLASFVQHNASAIHSHCCGYYKLTTYSRVAIHFMGFPDSSVGKESACNAGDMGSIPGLGRSPGKRNGNPLQYSYLENPMDKGAWRATVHGVETVGHNLVTKPPPPIFHLDLNAYFMLEINSAEMLDPRL